MGSLRLQPLLITLDEYFPADFFTCNELIFLDTTSLFKTTWDKSGTFLFSKVIGCRYVDVGSKLFSLFPTLEKNKLINLRRGDSFEGTVQSLKNNSWETET